MTDLIKTTKFSFCASLIKILISNRSIWHRGIGRWWLYGHTYCGENIWLSYKLLVCNCPLLVQPAVNRHLVQINWFTVQCHGSGWEIMHSVLSCYCIEFGLKFPLRSRWLPVASPKSWMRLRDSFCICPSNTVRIWMTR